MTSDDFQYLGPAPAAISRSNEPPVGTWVMDRHGAATYRQESGWGEPGFAPLGVWTSMWDARGPYVECGPWGMSLDPTATERIR
ncbi:hypothetical protein ACFVAJ_19185 [Agromyces sp. NPDC057679]|uniref:hypothetical protein n=1 Tax=Agromyces sp. NPDC057679 TaxID=3346207 RepID=UPI00366C7BCB